MDNDTEFKECRGDFTNMEKSNIKVATTTGTKIQEMLNGKEAKNDNNEPKSVVYEIPCKGCY